MAKVNKKTMVELTTEALLNMIYYNNYGVGSKLPNEHDLANQLEVGRNTLREAIGILAAKNILEVRRGSGTFVSSKLGLGDDPLGMAEVYDKDKMASDLILMRILLEPKIAALAAQNATAEEINRLLTICDEMDELLQQNKTYLLNDLEFHSLVASASRNLVINHMIPAIHQALLLERNIPKQLLGVKALKAHRDIAEAIRDKRSSDAYDHMLMHLMQNNERIKE